MGKSCEGVVEFPVGVWLPLLVGLDFVAVGTPVRNASFLVIYESSSLPFKKKKNCSCLVLEWH